MTDQEMLDAMKTILYPINSKLNAIELKIDNLELKLDTIKLEQKMTERSLKKDIHYLNDEVDTLIEVLEAKGILPKVK